MGYTDVLFPPTTTAYTTASTTTRPPRYDYTDIMRQVEQEQELRRSTRSRRIMHHPFDFFDGTTVLPQPLPQLPSPPVLTNSHSHSHRSAEEEMDDDDAAAALLLHQALTQAEAAASSPTPPLTADKLLAQELNSLSMVDRERVYDEIHGIHPPNRRPRPRSKPPSPPGGERVLSTTQNSSTGWESSCSGTTSVSSLPSVVEEQRHHDAEEEALLFQFQDAVATLLRAASVSAASSSSPHAVAAYPAYRYANFHGSQLLRDRNFQLSFLTTESQHPRNAALRFLKHLEAIHHVFETPAVLFRPIQLSDLEPTTVLPAAAAGTKKTTSTKKNKRKNKKRTSTTGTTKQGRTGRSEENETSRTLSKGVYTGKRLLVEHGFLQLLPVRDTSGRRILCHFREPPTVASNVKARQQVGYYISQTVADDPNGCILLFFLHDISSSTMNNPEEIRSISKLFHTLRLRFSAVHLCCPAGPMFEAVKAMYTLFVGKENRSRIRFHTGSYQECTYSLKSFGIPIDRLPHHAFLTKSVTVVQRENSNQRKWIAMQEALEAEIAQHVVTAKQQQPPHPFPIVLSSSGLYADDEASSAAGMNSALEMDAYNIVRSKYVECAYHEDCLFGKGRPAMKHPGNIGMRRILEEKYNQYQYVVYNHKGSTAASPGFKRRNPHSHRQPELHLKTKIAIEVVQEIKRGSGRFLKEVEAVKDNNDKTIAVVAGSGLLIAVDDKAAVLKIKIALRDLKKRKKMLQDRADAVAEQGELPPTSTKKRTKKATKRSPSEDIRRPLKKRGGDSSSSSSSSSKVVPYMTTSLAKLSFYSLDKTSMTEMDNDDGVRGVGTIESNSDDDDEFIPLPLDSQDLPMNFSSCDAAAMIVAVGNSPDDAAAVATI